MRIGIDIDDCVTKTAQYFCRYYSTLFNKNITLQKLLSINAKFEDTGIVTSDQVRAIKDLYWKKRMFRTIESYPNAIKVLKNLTKHKIFFISNRNDYLKDFINIDTNYWFKSNGINKYKLILTQDKATEIKNLDLDLYIEDNIFQASQIRALSNIEIIMLCRPWNKKANIELNHITRVHNWNEINNIINTYDKKN